MTISRLVWDEAWLDVFNAYRARGASVERARTMAWKEMRRIYGERPEPEKAVQKLPWRYRILGKVAIGRLEGVAKSLKEGSMGQRLMNAAVYGVAAVFAALQASGIPKDEQGWLGIVGVFFAAAYGKFSSNQTFVAPNRPTWTDEQRAANTGK